MGTHRSSTWWIASVLFAATPAVDAGRYHIHTYTVTDGLPNSQVLALTQEPSGLMWFATRSSIATYDGQEWLTRGRMSSRLSAQNLLHWDTRAQLWALPPELPIELQVFDGARPAGNRWQHIPTPEPAAQGRLATALAVSHSESGSLVAVGTDAGALHLWNGIRWQGFSTSTGDSITALSVLDNRVLVATHDGIWVLDGTPDDLSLTRVPSTQGHDVLGLCRDDSGKSLWLVGTDWIGRLGDEGFEVVEQRLELGIGAPIPVPDGDGGLYLGYHIAVLRYHPRSGIQRFDPSNGLVSHGALGMLMDREQNLWIGTARGVSKIISQRFASFQREHGLLEDEVTAVLQRRSGEFVLGHNLGLSFVTDLGEQFHTLRFVDVEPGLGVRVLDLAEDHRGDLWAAVEDLGLAQIDRNLVVRWHDEVPGEVRSVLADHQGQLWVASSEGLYTLKGKRFRQVELADQFPRTMIRRLVAGADGALYLATAMRGLYRLHAGQWQSWVGLDDAANNVFAVLEIPEGGIWVGTAAGLLRTEQESLVKASGPATDRPVYFLARDHERRIWIGTDNGVLRWDGSELKHYTIRDGLVGRETNRAAGLVDSVNRVWIGTDRGVSVYRSQLDEQLLTPPAVELLDFEVDDQHFSLTENAELAHGDNTLVFYFRAISFVDETRVRVRTWLEGFEPDWLDEQEFSRGEIRYTNLSPGRYRFHLQAANADGLWSEVVSSAAIVIRRPFWLQTWFPILCLALFATLGFLTQHFISRRKQVRKQELARMERLEALGVLAGGIAHDFNNLLTVILGNLAVVKLDEKVSRQKQTNLANIDIAIQRTRDLTQQLLTFSRGGAPTRKTSLISEVIHESATCMIRGPQVRCDIALPEELWPVDIDSGQMNQVMNNLLINAQEAMPKGGTVGIIARNLVKAPSPLVGDRHIEIAIQDEGHGIPQDQLDRIFDPYCSTKHRGSGLGLATAYSIVSRHNGLLTVESAVGKGTTFHIYLPASRTRIPTVAPAEAAPSPGNERILVMDDEEPVREVLGELLTRLGYDVEFATEGGQALSLYKKSMQEGQSFEAVIMDLTVSGGMGGREATERILEFDPQAKVIAMSGYCNDSVMSEHTRYGFLASVSKPFHAAQLSKVLREVIEESCVKTQ